jgi:hypothetical protein
MQVRGTQSWHLPQPPGGGDGPVATHDGDVLILPAGLTHGVTTPGVPHPGYSLTVAFRITC